MTTFSRKSMISTSAILFSKEVFFVDIRSVTIADFTGDPILTCNISLFPVVVNGMADFLACIFESKS